MQGPNNTSTKSFKQAFLMNLLLSLQQLQQAQPSKHDAPSLGGGMSLHERTHAVKSSADIAMAAARGGQARWPKVILASTPITRKVQRCRRIVRAHCHQKRSFKRSGRGVARTGGGEVARRLVRRRTMTLREVIPGGWDATVDEATLLREAMDYVVHLHAQVDVLRQVSQAVLRSSSIIQMEVRCRRWLLPKIKHGLHASMMISGAHPLAGGEEYIRTLSPERSDQCERLLSYKLSRSCTWKKGKG